MSRIIVDSLRGNSASSDAISLANDGTCTANITNNLSNRNLIINGAMQVAQRGTTTGMQSGYGGTDRYYFYMGGDGRATVSRDTDVPTGQGFSYSTKIDVTTADSNAASNRGWWGQRIERDICQPIAKGTSNAKQLTLSFWIKSPKTGTHIVRLYDNPNDRDVGQSYTVSTANTWEKKTVTFPADTTGTIANGTTYGLQVYFLLVSGANTQTSSLGTTWATYSTAKEGQGGQNLFDSTSNNIYFTGIQLEVGSNSTDYEFKSYAQELALCQRYYETHNSLTTAKTTDGSVTSQWSTITSNDSNTLVVSTGIIYKVPKRASPTVTIYNSSDTTTAARVNAQGTERTVTASYGGPNALTRIYVSGASAGNYVTYNWEANAEL